MLYSVCWGSMGDIITDLITALFAGHKLPPSMRTALMLFGTKPKKLLSLRPQDKRRISILNCDFKVYEGVMARRFRKMAGRTLSLLQYVAGSDHNIQHGIARARDAITAAAKSRTVDCGIGDQDYIMAFDYLVLSWVWRVLEKKGVKRNTLQAF